METAEAAIASLDVSKAEKPRDLSILICCPVHDRCTPGFAYSISRAMAFFAAMPYDGKKNVDVTMVKSSNLAEGRTRLVSRAFQLEATHILWVDSDMKFPEDAIPALLNRAVPVIGVNYPTKEIEARPTAYADNDDYVGPVWSGDNAEGIAEVSHCGMGLMLTDVRVFEALELPYFSFEAQAPDFIHTATEDVYFCRKLKEKDIKVYIDHDLSKRCAHVGDFEYTNKFATQAEQTKQTLYRALEV